MNTHRLITTKPDADDSKDHDAGVASWHVGDTLPDGYVIRKIIGKGGMGTVFLVERKIIRRNLRFAVKTLSGWKAGDSDHQRAFLKELRTWIDLPPHPNLVACRFFRTYEDNLAIFSDYIEGGTLADWIAKHKLKTIGSILDIAIQIAWGLQAAHTAGVVHQDVKPGNIMITGDGTAKITDFSLAKISVDISSHLPNNRGSEFVSCDGMTIAYCSPEQYGRLKITSKTDIWSFGLTFLEMFTGKITWNIGAFAEPALNHYRKFETSGSIRRIPESIVKILEGCLKMDPSDRWGSMEVLADRLIDAYRNESGTEYPRKSPAVGITVLPARTNERRSRHGVTWMDPADKLQEIIRSWGHSNGNLKKADNQSSDSQHAMALSDLGLFEEIVRILDGPADRRDQAAMLQLILVLTDKAIVHEYLGDHSGALRCYDRAIEFGEELLGIEWNGNVAWNLAKMLANKGISLREYGSLASSRDLLTRAVDLLKKLVSSENALAVLLDYSKVLIALGALNFDLADYTGATETNREAIQILETIVYERGDDSSRFCLALAHANNANALCMISENDAAIKEHTQAAQLLESIINKDPNPEFRINLANIYSSIALNQAISRNQEAYLYIEKSNSIMETLVLNENRREYLRYLAWNYRSRAEILMKFEQYTDAVEYVNKSIESYEKSVSEEGRDDLLIDMAHALSLRSRIFFKTGEKTRAMEDRDSVAEFLQLNLDETGRDSIRKLLDAIEAVIESTR